jgi:hypothetical protein
MALVHLVGGVFDGMTLTAVPPSVDLSGDELVLPETPSLASTRWKKNPRAEFITEDGQSVPVYEFAGLA